jgi:phage internal scaffolding protein
MLVNHKTGEVYTPERRVKQSFVDECDINNILKQYSATGQLKHIAGNAAQGAYMDLPDDVDYQVSQNVIIEANRAFASLPAKTRDRFGNDPGEFLAFMADPANQDEAIKLGLATRKVEAPEPGTGDGAQKPPQAPSAPPAAPLEPDGSKPAPKA